MAKTITLSKTSIQSINLNRQTDKDGNVTGICSAVHYVVHDDSGNEAMYKSSFKYTAGTDYAESQIMTSNAETKLMAYWDEMASLMKEREEI